MERFFWIGGARWIDLVNTEMMRDGMRAELLETAEDALAWLHVAKVAAENETTDEKVGAQLLNDLRALRGHLRVLCEAVHAQTPPPSEALSGVNNFVFAHRVVWQLRETDGELRAEEVRTSIGPSAWLGVLAREAVETLGSDARAFVKPCANPACILWFLDTSKNRARRWCSMEGCGNRLKVAAHYARKKAAPEG